MMFTSATVILWIVHFVLGQNPSPCPDIFSYEPRGHDEDRWYGVLTLKSKEDLQGVWLRIALDQPVELLGNWFGDTISDDNQEFVIKNRDYKLNAGTTKPVRFFVKYNRGSTIPSLKSIRLNARTICEEGTGNAEATTPQIHISHPRDPSKPVNRPNQERPPQNGQDNNSASTGSNSNGLSEEGNGDNGFGYFPGDFAATSTRRPTRPVAVPTRNGGCGTVAAKASPLISFGQNTTRGQWPWHAALYYTEGIELKYTCGGTLISENHVLTAAHCVTVPQTNRPIDATRLTVYLGKYNLKKFGSGTQTREVNYVFIHPRYNHSVYFNDIALLKLDASIDVTNLVRPCCLWEGSTETENIINKLGTVVGWGFDENKRLTDSLMQAQMPVVSTVTCIYSNRDFFSQFTFEKTYCAGFRNGTTVCNGDSGGGMVFPRAGTDGQNTVWQIRGIVSVGVALQGEAVCDPQHYIVFTDVAKHLDWIQQAMRQ